VGLAKLADQLMLRLEPCSPAARLGARHVRMNLGRVPFRVRLIEKDAFQSSSSNPDSSLSAGEGRRLRILTVLYCTRADGNIALRVTHVQRWYIKSCAAKSTHDKPDPIHGGGEPQAALNAGCSQHSELEGCSGSGTEV
jgi:hypothetical protein